MTKTIHGVPESLTRAAYISLFEAVGIDPYQILDMTFRADGVHATVFALDEDGRKVIENDGLAKHSIYIPVED